MSPLLISSSLLRISLHASRDLIIVAFSAVPRRWRPGVLIRGGTGPMGGHRWWGGVADPTRGFRNWIGPGERCAAPGETRSTRSFGRQSEAHVRGPTHPSPGLVIIGPEDKETPRTKGGRDDRGGQ